MRAASAAAAVRGGAALLRAARSAAVPLPDVPKFRTNLPIRVRVPRRRRADRDQRPTPVRRVVDGSGAVLLAPAGDAEAFADALAGVLRDPARAAALAACGRALIEERCHWEREAHVLLDCYATLGRRRPGAARVEEAHA